MLVVKANSKDLLARVVLPLLMLATPGCEKPEILEESGSAPFPTTPLHPTFPIEREITDLQGRKLKVSIIAKTGDDIIFTREIDGKTFRLPILQLASEDRTFAAQLLPKAPPEGLAIEGESSSNEGDSEPRYVTSRKEEIRQLELEYTNLREEAEATSNSITRRSNYSEMERLNEKIAELKIEIQVYQENNPR